MENNLIQSIEAGNHANAIAREQEITRLNEVCRANQSTVDIYKAERDALRELVADLTSGCEAALDYFSDRPSKLPEPENRAATLKIIRAALAKVRP